MRPVNNMNNNDYFKLNNFLHFEKSTKIRKAIFLTKLKEKKEAIKGFHDKIKQDLINLQNKYNIKFLATKEGVK